MSRCLIPHALTFSRLMAALPLAWLTATGQHGAAALLLALAIATDFADGRLARHFGTSSDFGAWFDVWADFALILAGFTGLALTGMISLWPILAIVFAFLAFIASSASERPVYDPVGRYIGGALMGALMLVLLTGPVPLVELLVIAACATTATLRVAGCVGIGAGRPA
ncbi:CDP-alcohol phosphatidyltransferase family protein [Cucumibacter marinus]|uniref:CDP-alcohol phosphatidyltransferase family protein n=1 Tax=Cucumibacter marinus TaxID=1121252 RepID=UPI000686253E|nr:CDP-alcohol phosphatidyltransferase family protein [Cucumibacter marinus]